MKSPLRLSVPTLVLAIALSDGAAYSQDAEKVALAAKFVKGAAADYLQTVTNGQDVTTTDGPRRQQEATISRAWTQTVESVADDGGATVSVRFGRINGTATNPMGTLQFDSDAAAAEPDASNPMAAMTGPFTKVFMALSGKTATVKLAKDGTPTEVQGLDHVADEVAGGGAAPGGGGGGGGGGPMGGMGRQMARAFAGPEIVKDWMRLAHPKLPDKPVGVGDTWTESWPQDAVAGRKMTVTVTYKVTAVDAETVSVAMDGKFDLPAGAAPAGKDGEKGGAGGEGGGAGGHGGGASGGAGGAGGSGGEGGAGGAGGAPGAPGQPGGKGGKGGGPGGRGGMDRAFGDATIEKSALTGTGKLSRQDGMMLVADSTLSLLFKSATSGAAMERSSKSHLERKPASAAPAAPPAAPGVK